MNASGLVNEIIALSNLRVGADICAYLVRCTRTLSPVRIGTARTLSLLTGTVGVIMAAVLGPTLAD